ncbi:MAG: hypothetical protein RIR14_1047, partial [Pseudomonadota bacterium]
ARRTRLIAVDPGGAGNLGKGSKGGAGRSLFGQKPVKGYRPDPARPDKAQPVQRIIPLGRAGGSPRGSPCGSP